VLDVVEQPNLHDASLFRDQLMAVSVMHVRHLRVSVPQAAVRMDMGMRFARRVVRIVLVLMINVMRVQMGVTAVPGSPKPPSCSVAHPNGLNSRFLRRSGSAAQRSTAFRAARRPGRDAISSHHALA
jgi:hypothetical protein